MKSRTVFERDRLGLRKDQIELPDGGKVVVNRHAAAQEVWVAARSGGFHFRWDGRAWRDTRNQSELMASLSALLSAQSGESIQLD